MKWWQTILVDTFTNKYFNIVFAIILFVVVTHLLGYHPEVWLAELIDWITGTDPTKLLNMFG